MNENAGQRDTDAEKFTEANEYCRVYGRLKSLLGTLRIGCERIPRRGVPLTLLQLSVSQNSASASAVACGFSALGEWPAPATVTYRAPSRAAIFACSFTGQA
jgi:hypothetical protein